MNKKLQEIGKKLNITEKDIQRMQKGFISRKILGIIVGIAIVILAFIVWVLRKMNLIGPFRGYPPGYPFAPSTMMGGYLLTKKKNSKLVDLLISAITFLSSLVAHPVFGVVNLYNVYKRDR
jgi:hypothetical protein